MQAQTALATALKDAGVRAPVHKKMRLGSNPEKPFIIAFLVKPTPQLASSAEAYERFEKRGGRKIFDQQGNIKLGETIASEYTPTSMRIVGGAGSKGDRVRVIFTMALRIGSDETELLAGGLARLALSFKALANTGYDFFDLYDNGENGYLMQLRGENTNNASCFIEV